MTQSESSKDDTNRIVFEIEEAVYKQFQEAAFQKYKESVLVYGSKVWREARSVALQRDPDVSAIEITTPDVEIATVRTEMKLIRLRQLRFPFRLVQQFVTLVTGIIAKLTYDSAHVQTGEPGKDFLFWCVMFLFCIATTLTLNYFEMRSELLR
ncbi:hypothetical protein [Chamaesiphon sp. VAR_48_metabat_403]|uniref:hypothetical protein n=1 Tax=Chamaesiphon sp. VAR_48_metabat_403 TaxID=2964700 RepID=UPI00286DF9BC|nr:hypothetical protein [Chamaesiphon sp. VAR_48_metabat_403]